MSRLLIVNADDFGLTEGVSRAILRSHRDGVVTSTSVLALGPAFERTVRWLDDAPGLGTGAHLAAVGEDPPLLEAREIPTLVDARGRLRPSWRQFLPLLAARRVDPADIHREFTAQLERIIGAGRTVDHLDTHQNVHLWPAVRDVLFELGERFGVRAVRVTRSSARGVIGSTVRRLARDLEARCDQHGWAYPQASTGLDEAGSLDRGGMVAAVDRLARGGAESAELATHPGERDDPDLRRYRWGYRWGDELEALCSRTVRTAIDEAGFRLGTFAELDPEPTVR
ncbi:carbohydrate deacetylase [Rhabdothermincola sp.]|uniref:carbohydrate deacetylase n=1 Tax=Rhabdothermincola sp. TaxID=2820405 RepID=UPI002FDF8D95